MPPKKVTIPLEPHPRHNITAYLASDDDGYRDAIRWLTLSRISYAIAEKPDVYMYLIKQFWKTAKFDEDRRGLVAEVDQRIVFIDEDVVRKALKFEDISSDPKLTSVDVVKEWFRSIGYSGAWTRPEVIKTKLSKEWRYIAHVFIHCLSHRLGGYDELTIDWAGAMMKLCKGERMNFSYLVYSHMCKNSILEYQGKKMMYPRFIQIILNWLFKDLAPNGDPYKLLPVHKKGLPTKVTEPWFPLLENMYLAERWNVVKEQYKTYLQNKEDLERSEKEENDKEVVDVAEKPEKEKVVEGKKRKGKHVAKHYPKKSKKSHGPTKGIKISEGAKDDDSSRTPSPMVYHEEDEVDDELICQSLELENQRRIRKAMKISRREAHAPPLPRHDHEAGPSHSVHPPPRTRPVPQPRKEASDVKKKEKKDDKKKVKLSKRELKKKIEDLEEREIERERYIKKIKKKLDRQKKYLEITNIGLLNLMFWMNEQKIKGFPSFDADLLKYAQEREESEIRRRNEEEESIRKDKEKEDIKGKKKIY